MLCHSSRGFGRDSRLPVSGSLTMRTLFQTIRPGIEFVEDKPSTALGVAIDRRRVPSPAARWTNVFPVKIVCDVPGRSSRGIRRENAPHDRSFVFDDFEFPRSTGHRSISVGAPAGMSTVAHYAGHATADLFRPVLALHLSNEAANPN